MASELLSFSDDVCLVEGLNPEKCGKDHNGMAARDDRVCLVHEVIEKQCERDREEVRNNFSELFSRLRNVERQIWWFGGVVAALIFLGDFVPKVLKAIGRVP